MSGFYVGQRVKLARWASADDLLCGPSHPGRVLIGDEGTVVGTDSSPNAGFVHGPIPRLSVHVDKLGVHGMAPAYVWEPITPPGLESLEDINALYETEPCEADVDSRGFRVPESIAIRGRRL